MHGSLNNILRARKEISDLQDRVMLSAEIVFTDLDRWQPIHVSVKTFSLHDDGGLWSPCWTDTAVWITLGDPESGRRRGTITAGPSARIPGRPGLLLRSTYSVIVFENTPVVYSLWIT